ncbi:MAG: hypothetical protein RBT59_07320, partial [Arcobacteraceae bacterium]|nr:hypothetical protein [Arcobacteraceae bacterium]
MKDTMIQKEGKVNSLKSILYSSFFKTSLLPIIIIEVTLLVLYFGISHYILSQDKDSLSGQIKNNLKLILEKEAQSIDFHLNKVYESAKILQQQQQNIFENQSKYLKIAQNSDYKLAPNKVFYKVKNDGGASLYYGARTIIGEKEKQKVFLSESFDDMLKYTVDKSDLIVASYFNSFDSMNRLYPFIDNVYSQYDPYMKIEEYNFYYESDKEHNPKKDAVWTSAYLDPAGQGWMVSCIVPIYKGQFLEGVTGLDVTIDSFIKNILNLKLPWSAQAFLVSNDGLILAMPKTVEEIFHINELKNHTYTDVVTKDQLKPEEFNIYKNPKLSRYFGNLLHSDTFMVQSTIDNKEYIIAQSNIEQTNWKLFIIVDKSIVYAPLSEMEKVSSNLGLIAIVGMILFYLLFFLFLHKRIIKISNFISEPIANLANITKNFTTNLALVKVKTSHVEEIDLLFKNFNEMTQELYLKKSALEELNRSLEFKVQSEVEKNRQKDQTLLQQSRLAQMGELISMIAHQWRQPLATISSMTLRMKFKIILENFDFSTKEGQEEFLNYIKDEIDNIDEMIQNLTVTIDDFRDFYKPTKEVQSLSPTIPIKKALSMLKPEFIEHQIEVQEEYLFEGDIDIYENEFMQVVLNILKNASDNFKEKEIENRVITIKIEEINEKVTITLGDNG